MFERPTLTIMPSARVVRVHLIRHGETEQGQIRVCRGQSDIPLSARGREQSRAVSDWLKQHEPGISHVFSSDLSRCRELADRLSTHPVLDQTLREQDMGRWEGRGWEALSQENPAAVTAYWNDYVQARPEGGESYAEVYQRVLSGWARILVDLPDGANVVVVTHVGVIRALLTGWLGMGPGESLRFAPGYASVATVLLAEAGAVLVRFGVEPGV